MIKFGKRTRQLADAAAGMLLPSAVFVVSLQLRLPHEVYTWLLPFSGVHFFVLMALYFVCFRLGGRARWLAGGSLTALVFGLLLARNWALGISNANIIAGFIPYKDGYYYYNSARELLAGMRIPASGLQGLFRPLFPGLLAVLLEASGHNLMAASALLTLLLAFCCFAAAHTLRGILGDLPAALWMALVVAFIAPMVGYSLSELPGLAYACLALVVLARGELRASLTDVTLGSLALVLANTIRAGAYFMLPLLLPWAAYTLYAGRMRRNLARLLILALVLAAGLAAANFVIPRLLNEPGASASGSFAWMLYGQAVGGAGWMYHYQALGSSDAQVVLSAAAQKILTYPQGLAIGALKAYRDFFAPSRIGIFDLLRWGSQTASQAFWFACIGLTVYGLHAAMRRPAQRLNALLACMYAGVLASIPFLPPIDGGNRFYAGAVPFIYAVVCLGLAGLLARVKTNAPVPQPQIHPPGSGYRYLAAALMAINLLIPPLLPAILPETELPAMECPAGQTPFAVELHPGAYADILPDNEAACGRAPAVCLAQFERYGLEKNVDDFYRAVLELAQSSANGIRLAAVNDLATQEFYFFILPLELAGSAVDGGLTRGCARQLRTEFQDIRLAQSVSSLDEQAIPATPSSQ